MIHLWDVEIEDASTVFVIKTSTRNFMHAAAKARRVVREAKRQGYPVNSGSRVKSLDYRGTVDL